MFRMGRIFAYKKARACCKENLFSISQAFHSSSGIQLTENNTKKMYSTIQPPPTDRIPIALLQGCQSLHFAYSVCPQQQNPLFR